MIRSTRLSPRVRTLAHVVSLAAALLAASGCGTEEITLAEVPADATAKVEQGQTKPVAKADRPRPEREQNQGRPY
jgi:hypothetical protein